jgi:uncharacterized protein (TIGR03000 family)
VEKEDCIMRLTGVKAVVCASVLALAAASNASAGWPGYYYGAGWYGGYWPAYSYWGNAYSYYPSYWGSYYSYYPSYTSYYYPYAYTYPTYYSYAPTYLTPQTVVAAPTTRDYRSFYPPETSASSPAGNEADVRVVTAPGAQLWFNGVLTTQAGDQRSFNTPDLQPGKTYSYEVKVRWMENGRPIERTRTVAVAAGQTVDLDLTPANLLKQ